MAAMAADPVFVAIGQPFQADVTLESLTWVFLVHRLE
jgi:hypothetical protein